MIDKKKLGYRINSLLADNDLSQVGLAEYLGRNPSTINRWLRGSNVPDPFTLYIVAKKTGVTLDSLLEGVTE